MQAWRTSLGLVSILMFIIRRKGDLFLLGYLIAIYAVLFGFFFMFGHAPLWGQAFMFWIGSILAGRIEAILHWSTHHPVFHSARLNTLHRLFYCVIPAPAIWYRHVHFHHHRFDNSEADLTSTLGPSGKAHRGLFPYLRLSLEHPNYIPFLKAMERKQRLECAVSFGLTFLITFILFFVDTYATLVFWIPVTYVSSALIVALYNYTDHVPGNPGDGFHYATYVELLTPYQRLLSFIDLHNISTHLTHHQFPNVYWNDLPKKQAERVEQYKAHGSPVSLAHNSGILFNPLAFLLMIYWVQRKRALAQAVSDRHEEGIMQPGM